MDFVPDMDNFFIIGTLNINFFVKSAWIILWKELEIVRTKKKSRQKLSFDSSRAGDTVASTLDPNLKTASNHILYYKFLPVQIKEDYAGKRPVQ